MFSFYILLRLINVNVLSQSFILGGGGGKGRTEGRGQLSIGWTLHFMAYTVTMEKGYISLYMAVISTMCLNQR